MRRWRSRLLGERARSAWANWSREPRVGRCSAAVAPAGAARVGVLSGTAACKLIVEAGQRARLPAALGAPPVASPPPARTVRVQSVPHASARTPYALYAMGGAVLLSGLFWLANRDVVELTGRSRTMFISKDMEKWQGNCFGDTLAENPVQRSDPRAVVVNHILANVLQANEEVMKDLPWDWEIMVLEDGTVNAFCFLAGKLYFYSGLLEFVANLKEDGAIDSVRDAVAGIIAHEAGHAVARHVAEGLSWLPVQIPFYAVSQQSPLMEYVFSFYFKLPHSRLQEYEADAIGLELMASAGYEPEQALRTQLALDRSSRYAEFSRTHPVGANRAAQLQSILPKARARYLAARAKGTSRPDSAYTRKLVSGLGEAVEMLGS